MGCIQRHTQIEFALLSYTDECPPGSEEKLKKYYYFPVVNISYGRLEVSYTFQVTNHPRLVPFYIPIICKTRSVNQLC